MAKGIKRIEHGTDFRRPSAFATASSFSRCANVTLYQKFALQPQPLKTRYKRTYVTPSACFLVDEGGDSMTVESPFLEMGEEGTVCPLLDFVTERGELGWFSPVPDFLGVAGNGLSS